MCIQEEYHFKSEVQSTDFPRKLKSEGPDQLGSTLVAIWIAWNTGKVFI